MTSASKCFMMPCRCGRTAHTLARLLPAGTPLPLPLPASLHHSMGTRGEASTPSPHTTHHLSHSPRYARASSTGGPTRVDDSHETQASQRATKTVRWLCDGGDMRIESCRVAQERYAPLFLSVATTYANGTASTGVSNLLGAANERFPKDIEAKGPLTNGLTWTIVGAVALLLGWKWSG
jgi:hypothetical protein